MSNGKFRISGRAAELIKQLVLPVPAQKLLYALIHEQDLEENGWRTGADWMEYACRRFHRPVSRFRALGCAPNGANTRFYRAAVPTLGAVPELFEHIELCPRRRHISWSFGIEMHELMSDMDIYGLMSLADLRLLSRELDLALLVQITLHQKKRWPEFVMFQRSPGFEEDDGGNYPEQIDLRATRSRLEPALRKWARHTGYGFVIGYEQHRDRPAYRQARIRFSTKTSCWAENRLCQFHPNTKVVRVEG